MKKLSIVAAATILSISATAQNDIITTAVEAGSFKTLATALGKASLLETLQGKGPFTVFAPTDAAFAKLPKGAVANLLKPENRDTLRSILLYHVVSGRMPATAVLKNKSLATMNGQRAPLMASKTGAMIAGSKIVKTDIKCSNGVIHVIDTVMMPSTDDIIGTAVKAGSFKTLAAAVKAAGLVKTLTGKGPFTVFAPTDAAFAKLPKGTVADLLKPENRKKLIAILTYHVVPGRVYASEVLGADGVKSVQGSTIQVNLRKNDKGEVTAAMVNQARIVKTDIDTTNGVIHVIDSVILPPAKAEGGSH
jgi:uncharacterized surface protein with fasciclin (FAS1) repeats